MAGISSSEISAASFLMFLEYMRPKLLWSISVWEYAASARGASRAASSGSMACS